MSAASAHQDLINDIEKSMSKTLYVTAYADACDELECPLGGGADYMDQLDSTPVAFRHEGAYLAGAIEQLNKKTLADLYLEAIEADGAKDTPKNRSDFGHYITMQSLGHGVSWFDDHADFPLQTPYHSVTAACIAQQDMTASSFDLESLDIDDEDDLKIYNTYKDFPEDQSPNPHYLRSAVGLARGLLQDQFPDDLDEKGRMKGLLISNIAKNEEIVLAGFRLLGAIQESKNYDYIGLTSNDHPSLSTAKPLVEMDVKRYIKENETTMWKDHPRAFEPEKAILSQELLFKNAFKGEAIPGVAEGKPPLYSRDYSPIVQQLTKSLRPDTPSLTM